MELRHRIGHRLINIPGISKHPVIVTALHLHSDGSSVVADVIIATEDGSMYFPTPLRVPLEVILNALDEQTE